MTTRLELKVTGKPKPRDQKALASLAMILSTPGFILVAVIVLILATKIP